MKAAADHVLEYALARAFERSDAALTERILEGCRRGRRADRGRSEPNPGRRRVLVGAAATLLSIVLVSVSMFVWPSSWFSEPVASSDIAVPCNRGGGWSPRDRTSFERGDVLVLSDPAMLRLDSGGTVNVRPGTVLRLDDAGALTLSFGTVSVSSGPATLHIASPVGTIRLSPGASANLAGEIYDPEADSETTLLEQARRIHMFDTALFVSLTATLLQGSGELLADGKTRNLQPGVAIQQDAKRDEAGLAQLRKQIGTWKVTVTVGERKLTGTEICRPGSGDHSIVSDTVVEFSGRRMQTTVLLSYDPRRQRYSGTYVDNFGGEIGLLLGPRSKDLKERLLQMNKFHGGEFGIRIRMTWASDDERRTIMETLRDGKWQRRREMVHVRQAAPPSTLFQVVLNVRDMQKQVEFYRDVLGLIVVDPSGVTDFSSHSRVRLSAGGVSLALHTGRKSDNSGDEARLSFRVADVAAARARVKRAGMPASPARKPSPGVTVVDCRDPEGNSFHLETHAKGK